MKFIAKKSDLHHAVSLALRAISSRSSLPILSNLLIEVDEQIRISGTDLEVARIELCPGEIQETGSITVPARLFSEIVSAAGDLLEVSVVDTRLLINSAGSQMKINTLPADEYPAIPKVKPTCIWKVDSTEFKREATRILPAVSNDVTKSRLCGMNLIGNGNLTLVATDTHRLAKSVLSLSGSGEASVIVPGRAIKEALTLPGDCTIEVSDTMISFRGDTGLVVSRTLEGDFPNYRKVTDVAFEIELMADVEDLKAAVNRCSIVARNDAKKVLIDISQDKIALSAVSTKIGSAQEELECDVDVDETVELAMNSEYFLQGLSSCEEPRLLLNTGGKSPMKIVDGNFEYVLMPMQRV